MPLKAAKLKDQQFLTNPNSQALTCNHDQGESVPEEYDACSEYADDPPRDESQWREKTIMVMKSPQENCISTLFYQVKFCMYVYYKQNSIG